MPWRLAASYPDYFLQLSALLRDPVYRGDVPCDGGSRPHTQWRRQRRLCRQGQRGRHRARLRGLHRGFRGRRGPRHRRGRDGERVRHGRHLFLGGDLPGDGGPGRDVQRRGGRLRRESKQERHVAPLRGLHRGYTRRV